MNQTVEAFEKGQVYAQEAELPLAETSWAPHAKFAGVSMKTLVGGAQTGGRFSTHLVRVLPGCEIGEHIHATQMELHEVFDGSGLCRIAGKEVPYTPGVSTIIPEGVQHSVQAGKDDLFLKATFIPALG